MIFYTGVSLKEDIEKIKSYFNSSSINLASQEEDKKIMQKIELIIGASSYRFKYQQASPSYVGV